MKTFMQKKENVERNWYVIDAEGLTLGCEMFFVIPCVRVYSYKSNQFVSLI